MADTGECCINCGFQFHYERGRKSYNRHGLTTKLPGTHYQAYQVMANEWPSIGFSTGNLKKKFLCKDCVCDLRTLQLCKDNRDFSRAKFEARGKQHLWADKQTSQLADEHPSKKQRVDGCTDVGTQTPAREKKKRKKGTMKAAKFDAPGDPSVLYVGQVPVPQLQPKEILIQVKASAINRADTLQRKGKYDPPPGASTILGLEASGIIYRIGPECKFKWAVGDKVMALLPGGGNADYAAVQEDHLMPVGKLKMEEAAAIPEAWLTAYQLLHFVGHMKTNDTVLIHAGGSGVGTAATQLVKLAGGHPIVTAGSEVKLQKAGSLGAEAGFNYKEVDFAESVLKHTDGKGVDMILDCVGGSYWEKNVKAIAMDGQWVLYGSMGGVNVEGPILASILRKRVTLVGTTLRARSNEYKAELIKDFTAKALPFFEAGGNVKLQPIVDKVFPLSKIGEAHQYMEDNKTVGKVVLSVSGKSGHSEL